MGLLTETVANAEPDALKSIERNNQIFFIAQTFYCKFDAAPLQERRRKIDLLARQLPKYAFSETTVARNL